MKKILKFIALPVMLLACLVMFGGCQFGGSKFEVDMQKIYVAKPAEDSHYIFIQFLAGDNIYLKTASSKYATTFEYSEYIPYTISDETGETRVLGSVYDNNGNLVFGLTITDCTKETIKVTISQYTFFTFEDIVFSAEIDVNND